MSVSSDGGGGFCKTISDGTLKAGGAGGGMERRSSVGNFRTRPKGTHRQLLVGRLC